jgi:PAS domain S-box-containing protein
MEEEYDNVDKEILLELGTGFDNNNNFYHNNNSNLKIQYERLISDDQNSILDNFSDLENMTGAEDNLLSPIDFLFLSQLNGSKVKAPRRIKSTTNINGANPKPRPRKIVSTTNLTAAGKPKAVKASKSKIKAERDVSIVSDDVAPKLKRSHSSTTIKKAAQTNTEGEFRRTASTGALKKSKISSNDLGNLDGGVGGGSYDNSYVDTSSGGNDDDTKCPAVVAKERRRERNKVLARKTRVKKKREMETLRDQVCQLQKENERLKHLVKKKLPSAISNQVLVACNIQLPDNVASAVQVLLSRLENIETSFGTKLQQHQKAFVISNSIENDNQIIYASRGFLELTGYEIHQVVGKNCRFLQGPETDVNDVNKIKEALNNSQEVRTIIRNYKQNGTPFWNMLQVSPLKDKNGNYTLVIATLLEVNLPSKGGSSLRASVVEDCNEEFGDDGAVFSNLYMENFHPEPANVSDESVSVSSDNNNNPHSDESVN